MMLRPLLLASGLVVGGVVASVAQVTNRPAENPLLQEVRQVGDALVIAMNKDDLAGAQALFATNSLVTWCNIELSRGHAGLQSFHERMLGGPVKRVEDFQCEIRFDETVTLLADGAVAVCSGSFNERFKPTGGRKIDLQGRWTATLTRQKGGWLIVNLQLSTDPFNNSLLNLAKQAGWVVGMVSLLVGAGVGFFLGRRKAAG